MSVKMQPTSAIKRNLGIEPNGKVQKFFANTCALHMDKYVPFDTGALANTVVVNNSPTSNVEPNRITYSQEYASYVYYGISKTGKPLNYQLDKHPQAGDYWDRRMVTAEINNVVDEVQAYIDRGA